MVEEKEKQYAYWLCSMPGVGNKTIGRLLESCGGTAQQVYKADRKLWEMVLRSRQLEQAVKFTQNWMVAEEYEKLCKQGIAFWQVGEEGYPQRLREIPDAPYGIFVKGTLPLEHMPTVAIIGARDCSEYGKWVAAELGRYLGCNGVQVISGMARGIDGISQWAALEAGGASFGVLGCGVDICYPAGNRKLYDLLIQKGGVLSSYVPGTPPKAQYFPPRNRMVSGLADVVVVIEARSKSGTLITVDMALEQGKEVYVVPGRISDKLSDGCNRLIGQGAGVILSPEEFLEELQGLWRLKKTENFWQKIQGKAERVAEDGKISDGISGMPTELLTLYKALDWYPQSLEQIGAKIPDFGDIVGINVGLMRLCMAGYAIQQSPGYFCRSREQNSILFGGNPL